MIGTLNKGLNRNIRDDGSTKDPQDPFGLITFDWIKPVKKLFFSTSFSKAHGAPNGSI